VRLVKPHNGPSVQEVAGKAWPFRQWVESDATARFARMARRLEKIGTPAPLVELAAKASRDEERHAGYCAELAAHYDHPLQDPVTTPSEIAPKALRQRQRVLYEVAASCLAETESTVMLVTLMDGAKNTKMRKLLREFARDEVTHARFGWAVLASHRESDDLSFLSEWIPWMLRTTAGDSFKPAHKGPEDEALLEHGVLPYSRRRHVFIKALDDVIFPGLEALGVDARPSRAWLATMTEGAA
jgi:hypothetical protein